MFEGEQTTSWECLETLVSPPNQSTINYYTNNAAEDLKTFWLLLHFVDPMPTTFWTDQWCQKYSKIWLIEGEQPTSWECLETYCLLFPTSQPSIPSLSKLMRTWKCLSKSLYFLKALNITKKFWFRACYSFLDSDRW